MAAGPAQPISSFYVPKNGLDSIAVDAAGNFYATTQYSSSIPDTLSTEPAVMIFPPSAVGSATPSRTITGSNTTLENPVAIALDEAENIYVAQAEDDFQYYPVVEFAAGAQGNVAPIRSFPVGIGLNTSIAAVESIAVDSKGYLYVVRGQLPAQGALVWDIAVFSPSQNGNVAPVRTIAGPLTGLTGGAKIILDSSDNIYASLFGSDGYAHSVVEFAAGASGNVAPIRTLNGGGNYPFSSYKISNPAVDSAGNIYVVGYLEAYQSVQQVLMEFSSTASGNTAPISVIDIPDFLAGGNIALH